MTRTKPETLLKPKLLAVSVAACFALNASPLRANPNGPTVVHGGVGFSGLGTSALTITNQAGGNAIINWNGFSIGVNDLTRFQQFANLAVLNRVTGSEISSILGSLQSDGRVFLINPNGIVFGASARIDTAGLVASSLGLSDQDFLANRLRFTEVPGAGAVVNNGVIETTSGGRVYLVAPTVENNGLIQSPQGAIVLAAGKEVELVDAASPFVTVKVASAEQAVNLGTLVSDGGQIGMFGALVRNAGVIEAGGAVAGPGGEIRLVATKDLTLEAGSTTSANGASGGTVLLQAEGGTNLISGTVEAKGSSGSGGTIDALGVRVGVVGHGLIDASGDTGGGAVRVGGDYQGANAEVQNAERTLIGADGVIRADAMTTGDGGRVIVWADGDARFYGSISAKGGAQGGNGGFVETSGKEVLQAFGSVNAGAPNGEGGTWLLDPTNINIVANNSGPDDAQVALGGIFGFDAGGPPPTTSAIGVNSINAGVFFGSVTLQAVQDINLQANVNLSNSGNLTLQAGDNIHMGANGISMQGNLTLIANDSFAQSAYGAVPTTGEITSAAGGGNITTRGGDLSASGSSVKLGNINTSDTVFDTPGGGDVNIDATTGAVATGSIVTGGGFVQIDANGVYGSVIVGPINTSNVYGYLGDSNNGGVSIQAQGNIVTSSIVTAGLHPGHGSGGGVFIETEAGTIVVNGSIDTRGANGVDNVESWYYAGTQAGNIALSRGASDGFAGNAITVNGSLVAVGGNGVSANGGSSQDASGADGGWVEIGDLCDGFCRPLDGGVSITGGINTSGGAGGTNTDPSFDIGGGSGGVVRIEAYGSVGIGSIVTRGGNGGSGGSDAYGDNSGGFGRNIDIVSGSSVSVSSIDTSGGHGGAGGGYGGEANGGEGGSAGWIDISGTSVSLGSVTARGGNGGGGGTLADYYGATGGDGGFGGALEFRATGGNLSVGAVNTNGGTGGSGGRAEGFPSFFNTAAGGDGGEGGRLFASASGSATVGPITANGGAGGAGGTAPGDTEFNVDGDASGGRGGDGPRSFIQISAGGLVTVASIGASGGSGGRGGTGQFAEGGDGGDGGSIIALFSDSSVVVGSIVARGGNGGAGGTALDPVNGETTSSGGDAGRGGGVLVDIVGNIASGKIDVSGGTGGNGGPVGADSDFGGDGGDGGNVGYYGMTINIAGPVLARGGNGGSMINASQDLCDGGCTPEGGSGGFGGRVYVIGEGLVQINVGGALGAVAIDVNGGNGGNGNPASSPAGNGGAGGGGGDATVLGTPDMTLFGSVLAGGGDGGAGGAGGGIGGNGGNPGEIYLDASSSFDSQTGDGIIFVLAGTAFDVEAGFGGASGGGGAGGPGIPGTFEQNSDYFGTIVVLDPLSVPAINEGFQQVVEGNDDTTAFVGGEKEDEEEDKSQKELGSCQG